jgi:hypothetical protein
MRRYLSGNAYAYDLETIIDHLEWFDGMIEALAGKIGDRARCVTYEEIVADPAETRRRVAGLCGIEARARKVPDLGDDRSCGEPYRKVFEEALSRAI